MFFTFGERKPEKQRRQRRMISSSKQREKTVKQHLGERRRRRRGEYFAGSVINYRQRSQTLPGGTDPVYQKDECFKPGVILPGSLPEPSESVITSP